MIVAIVVWAFL